MAKKNPEGNMPLLEHIQEFRARLIVSLIALAAGTVLGYIWYGTNVGPIPSLGELLRTPYCDIDPAKRLSFGPEDECRLLATSPFEMFLLRLKVGALAGTVPSCPVWLGQFWGFVTPGLEKKERRFTLLFISLGVVLFVAGTILAYVCIPLGLNFLTGIGEETQVAALTGREYFNFLLQMLILFGFSFELPLVVVMLNLVGVLRYSMLKGKRRVMILAIFVLAAFITPGQDPFGLFGLGVALSILMEVSLQFCRFNDRRRADNRPEWMDTDDDAASTIAAPSDINFDAT